MADTRIIDLPEAETLDSATYIAVDSSAGGTKKVPVVALGDKVTITDDGAGTVTLTIGGTDE